MKIFVLGADGQLGMSLRKISGEYPEYDFVYTNKQQVDITDAKAVRHAVATCEADAIVNCAAYTSVDRAESEPQVVWEVNAEGARNVAEAAREAAIPLAHISTDYVFGGELCGELCGELRRPLTEDDLPNPATVYGRTKLAGEQAVREVGGAAAVIRTSWLYSEFGENFVRTMLRRGAGGERLRVVDDQWGSPTWATDLARAIVRLLERGVCGYEVYNFCGAGVTTWYDFAREIFHRAGMTVCVEPISTADYLCPARRPAYSALDTTKIRHPGIAVPAWQESLGRCLEELHTRVFSSLPERRPE
ncbi:MAG: dTDP-4-dehydrorhamnose reductase [Rikenellaceae bacterium]|nr:dTDP-4-dehydrorhamnose reductase [Rikenellaceae bacterium]MCL2692543.1 dTDP-4-dehydrorhamnose reductase [Rikenellaceae bacterium]